MSILFYGGFGVFVHVELSMRLCGTVFMLFNIKRLYKT